MFLQIKLIRQYLIILNSNVNQEIDKMKIFAFSSYKKFLGKSFCLSLFALHLSVAKLEAHRKLEYKITEYFI
jgi:hypothetical protein